MKRLIRFARRHPLLACSLAANAALAFGLALDHRHQAAKVEGAMEQMWSVDGSYVQLLEDWNAAVLTEDEQSIAELSRFTSQLAEARQANAQTLAVRGFNWTR